jgi:hypothetical protein
MSRAQGSGSLLDNTLGVPSTREPGTEALGVERESLRSFTNSS